MARAIRKCHSPHHVLKRPPIHCGPVSSTTHGDTAAPPGRCDYVGPVPHTSAKFLEGCRASAPRGEDLALSPLLVAPLGPGIVLLLDWWGGASRRHAAT